MTSFHTFVRYWLPVIVLCAVIFVQSHFPTPETLPRWPFGDKFLHAGVYGLLGALFCRAFNSLSLLHRRALWLFACSVLAATLYGLSDEYHQSFVSARTAESADLLADMAGSVLGSWAYLGRIRQLS